jgi:Zn-dependent protease with chaperone function
MFSELCKIIRASFNRKLILYEIVVFSFTIFGTFPNLIIKLLCLPVFFVAGILFVPILTSRFASQLRLILSSGKEIRIPISNEIEDLSRRMGVQLEEVRIRGDLCNAFVRGKTLVLGIKLLERLSLVERQAVVAHELGHVKERHGLVRFLSLIPLSIIPMWSWAKLNSPIFFTESLTLTTLTIMMSISFLAYIIVVMIPINWTLELRADRISARYVGKENIKSALLAITDKENLEESSEDHPSISERIKYINKLEI